MTEQEYVGTMVKYLERSNRQQVHLEDFFKEDKVRWTKANKMNMIRSLHRSSQLVFDYRKYGNKIETIIRLS